MFDCVDLFAGIGGQSTGAIMAGNRVLWAANHWQKAVEFHALNHPETQHACQDLQQADFSQLPKHDLLLASPCCQGHSNARGKNQKRHDNSRSTAWAVVAAAEMGQPEFMLIENVPEFMNWNLYPVWLSALHRMGYTVQPHIFDAAEHGVAQHRTRLFLLASKSKNPIKLNLEKENLIGANTVIDLNSGNWSDIYKPGRSAKTIKQIENGKKQLKKDVFLIPYYGSGSGLTGRDIERPIGTITTKARWAVINGEKMRMLTTEETRDFMSFPESTKLPKSKTLATHLLGNAVAPVLEMKILKQLQKVA